MKRVLLFLIVASFFSVVSKAQNFPTLPDQVEVFFPKALQDITVKQSAIDELVADRNYGQGKPVSNKRHWVAFSDRSDNTLYSTSSNYSATCGSLDFNEEVRIAKIERGYALVYVEDEPNTPYPKISSRAKSGKKRGWISLKNLLLWHTCPTNESGIYHKALLCVNLDQLRNQNYDLGNLYSNPIHKDKGMYEKLQAEMDFFFIMKRENGMVLLSKSHSNVSGISNNMLKGWVSEKSFVPWDQRTCIEPTWETGDVKQLLGKSFKVYGDQALTKKGIEYTFTDEVRNREPYEYRMRANLHRFPILSTIRRKNSNGEEDIIYKCSTFATSDGRTTDIGDLADLPDVDKITAEKAKNMTNIDIAFVIDGTKSMNPYFESVKNAIAQAENFFESDKFKIRVGLVIYRDYIDGDGKVEFMTFRNPKHPDLIKMLDDGGKYGIGSHRNDRSLEEALYLGIDTALDELGFVKGRSNLLFVVGDCGNIVNDKQYSREDIIQKLVDKDVNLMGFQVRNGVEAAYGDFNSQIKYLMRSSVDIKYKKLSSETKVVWRNTGNGVELQNTAESWIYIGTHMNPDKGTSMSTDNLTKQIGDAVAYFKKSVDSRIGIVSNHGSPGFKSGSNIEALKIDEGFFKDIAGDDYEALKNTPAFLSFSGYTPKRINGIDATKTVVFMSADELQELLTRFQPVAEAAKSSSRDVYQNAMVSMVRALTGHDDETIKNMAVKDVMQMVSGLNESTEALSIPLKDITDVRKVSPAKYQTMVSNFSRKYTKLRNIRNRPYDYTKIIDGVMYYWLPIEYLP